MNDLSDPTKVVEGLREIREELEVLIDEYDRFGDRVRTLIQRLRAGAKTVETMSLPPDIRKELLGTTRSLADTLEQLMPHLADRVGQVL